MPTYQLQLQYADGHQATVEHYAFAMLRVGDVIRLTPDEWRINGTAPADDWRFASKLLCRLEPAEGEARTA